MEHDWKKATLKPAVAVKNRESTNLTRHFKGGFPSLEGGMTPLNNLFGKKMSCTHKVNVINNSAEFIWIFAVDNSINANLTEK